MRREALLGELARALLNKALLLGEDHPALCPWRNLTFHPMID
jgi:hypothetical protein